MAELTTLQRALETIRKLKKMLEEKQAASAPIAIIGVACRMAEVQNKEDYWQRLCEGKNMITQMPQSRWDLLKNTKEAVLRDRNHPYWGSYLENISTFDPYFFGITPREARLMDPQQRLLLEVAYESFEDAGVSITSLAGSQTGVFSSLYASQFGSLLDLKDEMDALYIPTGNAISMAANRISYLYDLRGPSMVFDTACSSSLLGVHLACLHLQLQHCELALVTGVNINFAPSINLTLAKAKMLSPAGQCKTFSASADGYVQGEGAAALLLKPLPQAIADKDRIYAVICGSTVNQDGKTNGLTAPNGLQQAALLRQAYANARLNPADASYVECHGTGTLLGDPIELQALADVMTKGRSTPCWIGSVKTNFGHLEPAAGLVSILKVALALYNKKIPPHLNCETLNPHFNFEKHQFSIPHQLQDWPAVNELIAGVSGFGFGGTNAHVVLREYKPNPSSEETSTLTSKAELFTLSAKNEKSLSAALNKWVLFLEKHPAISLAALCQHLHLRRSHYESRLAIIAENSQELLQILKQLVTDFSWRNDNVFVTSKEKFPSKAVLETDDLYTLAQTYVDSGKINWEKYEEGRHFSYFDLPLYTFQRDVYWPAFTQTSAALAPITSDYPLCMHQVNSAIPILHFELSTSHLPELKDTFWVVHAGYYLEMLVCSVDTIFNKHAFSAHDIQFISPIFVVDHAPVSVQLILSNPVDQHMDFAFYSKSQKEWLLNVKGRLLLTLPQKKNPYSNTDMQRHCTHTGNAGALYEKILAMGMPAGPSIRWTAEYWKNETQILCTLKTPSVCNNRSFKMRVHPGVVDGCIQSIFGLVSAENHHSYMASYIKELRWFGESFGSLYLFNELQEEKPDFLIANWHLVNENDASLLECEGLRLQRIFNTTNMQNSILHPLDFSDLTKGEIKEKISHFLKQQLASICEMPIENISMNVSLQALGMDSLMNIALVKGIEAGLGLSSPLAFIDLTLSLDELTERLSATIPTLANEPVPMTRLPRSASAQPPLRLFCFPYGGGGASIYRDWQSTIGAGIEVRPIQLPGREERLREAPFQALTPLLDALLLQLEPEMHSPFAFFGHSFGALIAFELTRRLRREQLSKPLHLFASAYPDPRIKTRNLENLITQLNEKNIPLLKLTATELNALNTQELSHLTTIFRTNGIIEYGDALLNKEVLKILLPTFIGDMRIVKDYQYVEEEPLDIPITVFRGLQDDWVPYEDHTGWNAHTHASCHFVDLNHGHLFIKDVSARAIIFEQIAKHGFTKAA